MKERKEKSKKPGRKRAKEKEDSERRQGWIEGRETTKGREQKK